MEQSYEFVVVKPIGKAEVVIRRGNIYELNGPTSDRPALVGLMHSYGKKEELLFPIFTANYYELKALLAGAEEGLIASEAPMELKMETPPLVNS